MPHTKKFLAILISSAAFSACMEDVDVTPDETVDTTPVDPGTGQVFPATGYTKIGNDGIILADQTQAWDDNGSEAAGTQWSCVRDNDTGLYWEVKTNDGGLRDSNWKYTWYDTNPTTNGGESGIGDTGEGITTDFEDNAYNDFAPYAGSDDCLDSASCDTEKYIADVNATQLCGFDDWRLPSADGEQDGVAGAQELQSLLNCQGYTLGDDAEEDNSDCDFANAPLIDIDFFPNARGGLYWSLSPVALDTVSVWGVNFTNGIIKTSSKNRTRTVRLVRASQSL